MKKQIRLMIEYSVTQYKLLDKNKFIVINDQGTVITSSCEKDTSYDYFINTQLYPFTPINKTIPQHREHDIAYLSRLKDFGISVPDYIHAITLSSAFPYMKDNVKYMLKSFGQARSLGQHVITNDDLLPMLHYINDDRNDYISFNKKYNINTKTSINEYEKSVLFKSLKNNDVYLSELIDFKKEYRVLYFLGTKYRDFLIEERSGYSVINNDERNHKVVDNKNFKHIPKEVLKKLKEFGDSTKFCMLSFDVYFKDDGSWGVFEYSTEFGVDYPGYYKKLRKQMTRAVLKQIKLMKKSKK